jgi:RNA polymerase sigma-70 factor (ECF subfamily)
VSSILQRIARKDRAAVEECIETYGRLIWALARKMCPNKEEAEDAVQEIFIDIWKNADKFDPSQSSEMTFVAMIARRRLIDRLRKFKRQPPMEVLENLTSGPFQSHKDIQDCIEARQAIEALNQLRPEQRQVLHLSICLGLSHQEIATLTGMPIGTVKSHARRGLIKVRELLGLDDRNNLKGATA